MVAESPSQGELTMRVLIAPAPFKGSLSSVAAADAIARGLRAGWPGAELSTTPLADGGEGTLHVLLSARDGTMDRVTVTDPFGRAVDAQLAWLPGGIAVVEMAQAAGLTLVTDGERDPMRASTYGVGQLIQEALDGGAREIWIGLGGSATVDGGLGLLQALGAQLLDDAGRPVSEGGQGLRDLATVDPSTLDARLSRTPLKALCDVDSVLLGPQGAQLYMPQKGASPDEAKLLAKGLERFADLVERDSGRDVRNVPGAGAAGGLGAALAFLGADLVSGSGFVMDALDVDRKLAWCDLVITGEGTIDDQTLQGKTIGSLADRCRSAGRPLVALCGSYSGNLTDLKAQGIDAVFPIVSGPVSRDAAMAKAEQNLSQTARNVGSLVRVIAGAVPR